MHVYRLWSALWNRPLIMQTIHRDTVLPHFHVPYPENIHSVLTCLNYFSLCVFKPASINCPFCYECYFFWNKMRQFQNKRLCFLCFSFYLQKSQYNQFYELFKAQMYHSCYLHMNQTVMFVVTRFFWTFQINSQVTPVRVHRNTFLCFSDISTGDGLFSLSL